MERNTRKERNLLLAIFATNARSMESILLKGASPKTRRI
ncbi:hypothetical protein ANCCEY_15581 [Ancylostoma ceylanicum]|uniref:Uncharacterized protein n=1 Tax=Ancylostoma ceylanicum TaxID=53326 RepID=A0A0D6L762_9BILA|nr:hypothetical protein ANCCEY_15581 [Ancylostoma ceylanicum]